jgi:hypothetical protein
MMKAIMMVPRADSTKSWIIYTCVWVSKLMWEVTEDANNVSTIPTALQKKTLE